MAFNNKYAGPAKGAKHAAAGAGMLVLAANAANAQEIKPGMLSPEDCKSALGVAVGTFELAQRAGEPGSPVLAGSIGKWATDEKCKYPYDIAWTNNGRDTGVFNLYGARLLNAQNGSALPPISLNKLSVKLAPQPTPLPPPQPK
jgi:hypothetical protein